MGERRVRKGTMMRRHATMLLAFLATLAIAAVSMNAGAQKADGGAPAPKTPAAAGKDAGGAATTATASSPPAVGTAPAADGGSAPVAPGGPSGPSTAAPLGTEKPAMD